MSKKLPIRLRLANDEDVPFIFNSWLKSYRTSNFSRSITNTVYFAEHHKLLERILKTNKVVIACRDDDPSQICGWACAGITDNIFTLHYIYVKHPFRGFGVGKALLNAFEHDPSTASIFTHCTKTAERLAAKYNMIYHPYILINDYQTTSDSKPESEEEPEIDNAE